MTKQRDPADKPGETESEGHIFRADTVPPPASGDAYSAATVVREAPPEALAAIRERKKALLEPNVPRFNLEDEVPESGWDVPPAMTDAMEKQQESTGATSDALPIQSGDPPEGLSAVLPKINAPSEPPPEGEVDAEENAMTMLRVFPSTVGVARAEEAAHASVGDILGPSLPIADADENPSAWPVPLSPMSRRPTWLLLLLGALVLAVLLVLAAAAWDSLSSCRHPMDPMALSATFRPI